MHYCNGSKLAAAFWALVAICATLATPVARAEGIEVKAADLRLVEDVYQLNADFDVNVPRALEDALQRGITLSFVVEFALKLPRWYWFDEEIAGVKQTTKLSFNALTRQYLVQANSAHKYFNTLSEAKGELKSIRDWQVVDRALVKKKASYLASLRMRLDTAQLPKPVQIDVIGSREWNLASDWYTWVLNT